MKRCGGVLMHISSLSGEYGIGTLGRGARKFVDFLHESGFGAWQVLPCGPCDSYNSPYSGKSAFAGNIYFIDPELLYEKKLLAEKDVEECKCPDIYVTDYEFLRKTREDVFRRVLPNITEDIKENVKNFCKKNAWAEDYALFCALKKKYEDLPWWEWDKPLMLREEKAIENAKAELSEDVFFYLSLIHI